MPSNLNWFNPTNSWTTAPVPKPDMHRVGIVIKVTWQSANIKRASFQKVRIDDLNSFQCWLLCAPADDLHYSCGTMHHGLCSSQSYSVNETTWSQVPGTLSRKKKKKVALLREGWRSRWRLHASRKVSCSVTVQRKQRMHRVLGGSCFMRLKD